MDAITKVNTYFPSSTWTSFSVLANLIVNNATTCTQTQFILLWVLVALFCFFNFALCFTDSITRPAFPPTDKNKDNMPDKTTYTVLLLPGWILPVRLWRRYRAMVKGGQGGQPSGTPDEEEFEEGKCLISKVIFLPAFHKDDPARREALEYFEVGDGRLHFQDWAQALLTTGTFLTLAILNTAYVACVFPGGYDPKEIIERTQGLASPPPPPPPLTLGLVGRKLLQQSLPTRIDPAVIRAVPTIVAFFVGGLLSFFRKPRHMVGYVPADQNPALMTPKQLKAFLEEKKAQASGDPNTNNTNKEEAGDAIVSAEISPGNPAGTPGAAGAGGQPAGPGKGGPGPTGGGSPPTIMGAPTIPSPPGVPKVAATGGSATLANTPSLPMHSTPSFSSSPSTSGSGLPGTFSGPSSASPPMVMVDLASGVAPPATVGPTAEPGTQPGPTWAKPVGAPSTAR